MISLTDICIDYGKKRVISGLNLRIDGNGLFGIVGRNGSGKSTLSLFLAGVIPGLVQARTYGEKALEGRAGLILQSPTAQFLAMTVKEEAGDVDLRAYGAEHLAEKNVFELSEGEKQKINLINNLEDRADIILLDEPLELLDPLEAKRFLTLINHCLDDREVVWLDKDTRFLANAKKVYRLGRVEPCRLPEKRRMNLGKNILSADVDCIRKDFRLRGSLVLREHEKVAVIGRNGSGKSTFLKCIAGMIDSDGVLMKPRTSYSPQNPSHTLFEDTVLGELKLGSPYVGEAVRAFSLTPLLKLNPSRLSKGQQKIVSIAASLNAPVVLLDEPTTWLDTSNSSMVYNLVNKTKRSMIIATHDKNIVRCCDRVLMADRGRIRECSDTEAERFFQGYLSL